MAKKKDIPLSNYEWVIEKMIEKFSESDRKFIITNVPLGQEVFKKKESQIPFEGERRTTYKNVEKMFFEEINFMVDLLIKSGNDIPKSSWQNTEGSSVSEKYFNALNATNLAMQLWYWYSIPYRIIEGNLFHIVPPIDMLGNIDPQGRPNIHKVAWNDFILKLMYLNMDNQKDFVSIESKYKSLSKAFIIGIVLFLFLLILLFI